MRFYDSIVVTVVTEVKRIYKLDKKKNNVKIYV